MSVLGCNVLTNIVSVMFCSVEDQTMLGIYRSSPSTGFLKRLTLFIQLHLVLCYMHWEGSHSLFGEW
jgi:hypothetical protein